MQVFECVCAHAHQWFVLASGRDDPALACCPDGHPVVTAIPLPLAHSLAVAMIPAATSSGGAGAAGEHDRYFVLLSDLAGCEQRLSSRAYRWEEAVAVARSLVWRDPGQAFARWDALPP